MVSVNCFIGTSFVGALAYADDIVLLAPTPCAMRKLLVICEIMLSIITSYLTLINLMLLYLLQAKNVV